MNTESQMKIESVKEDNDKVTVVTTGARYIIDKSGKTGKISCCQVLNKERLVTSINFNCSLSDLTVEKMDNSICVLHQYGLHIPYIRLQINSDSLLDIYSFPNKLNLTFQGNFLPDYNVEKDGNVLLIDEAGGIGVYPYQGLERFKSSDFTDKEWKIDYALNSHCRFLVSIFPPRRFNHTQSFDDRIAHHGSIGPGLPPPVPSNDEIEELNRYANILVLHEMIWQGKYTRQGRAVKTEEDLYADAPFCSCDFVPVDEKELVRGIKKAHSLGMKVIPYMSPFYSTAKGQDFLDRVEEILKKYQMDGVYFDGISNDILYSYQMIRDTRRLLKDKILYLHCTSDPLGKDIYCPFIDTYADYILRAEHVTNFTDEYLRYVISGYNISNAIGHICYFDFPLDFIKKLIDKALAVNARFYLGSPGGERERLLKKEYFPKLKRKMSKND